MDNNKLQITTLDDIRVLRKQALVDVQQQKKALGTTARKLIAPLAPTVNKGWLHVGHKINSKISQSH